MENFLLEHITRYLPFTANEQQAAVLRQIAAFLLSKADKKAFLLNGYAGTGKTSIIAALVQAMQQLQMSCVLLAPTGRAAKVMSHYAGVPAYTIHRFIYRGERGARPDSGYFSIGENKLESTLFIVDEASMLSNQRDNTQFGSGSLLDDLIRYIYTPQGNHISNHNSLLLLGDSAQLPPVGHDTSPALEASVLMHYGLDVTTASLTQVARQALDSTVLQNATAIRSTGQIELHEGKDLHFVAPNRLQETLEQAYRETGMAETIILTRSNRRTNLYNQGVRATILFREDALSAGDRLMISRNNYFWTQEYEQIPFLANGDTVEVTRLRNLREMYGFQFTDASLRLLDYDYDIDATVWLDTLTTDTPEQTYNLHRTLYERIAEDYPEVKNRKELNELIRQSPYYQALQIRFAYAVTCHKAQGGQWDTVFIDAGQPMEQISQDPSYLRWTYTALTRAKQQVFWVNYELRD
ncbi:MAG: AAA family ATPase [Paludibacteraceae bacterium]|nr:AAA family ATPase [Paludibacteraceae bacterium]